MVKNRSANAGDAGDVDLIPGSERSPAEGNGSGLVHIQGALGFPAGASGKELACQCRRHKTCRFDPWVREIPWRRAW